MRRSRFFVLVIFTNLCFIFLQIHKQSKLIKLTYHTHSLEHQKSRLSKQKQELTHTLYAVNDRATVKNYLQEHRDSLPLAPVRISQVKKVPR